MAVPYLTDAPLEQAVEGYLALLAERGMGMETETVPVQRACGRVTARAVYALASAPCYTASTADGAALRAQDTLDAGPDAPVFLPRGQYAPLEAGDPVPGAYDAVVTAERFRRTEDGILLSAPASPWQHIRQVGEDVCAGEMLLTSDAVVTPEAMGALVAAGVSEVEVVRRPVAGIVPIRGRGAVQPEGAAQGDSLLLNCTVFSALLEQWGAQPRLYPAAEDELEQLRAAAERAARECDLVILSAGLFAGREAVAVQAIGQVGEVFCRGVAIKPGRGVVLGCVGPKPILGVPGYPVSGVTVLEQVLERLCRCASAGDGRRLATLVRPVASVPERREFVRVRMGYVGDKLVASPLGRGSSVVTSFMRANGILEIPEGVEGCPAGGQVPVRLLRPEEELRRTLVAIGSHDPLLDELADLLHSADRSLSMCSVHVGSMGGVMAVKRGEAHVAGVHLLNEKDGQYNLHVIKKHFPRGGVRLVECVGRVQGLMVAGGNPLGIGGLADLVREDVYYVNRQRGSGTRFLIDYLCRREGIDTGRINGYGREEFTHTAVAARIAAGEAGAGLGILSAARLYGLDFLPVYNEQYDLLIPDAAWDTPMVVRLLEIMRGEAFRKRLERLGGYLIGSPGAVRARLEPQDT